MPRPGRARSRARRPACAGPVQNSATGGSRDCPCGALQRLGKKRDLAFVSKNRLCGFAQRRRPIDPAKPCFDSRRCRARSRLTRGPDSAHTELAVHRCGLSDPAGRPGAGSPRAERREARSQDRGDRRPGMPRSIGSWIRAVQDRAPRGGASADARESRPRAGHAGAPRAPRTRSAPSPPSSPVNKRKHRRRQKAVEAQDA